MGADFFTYLGQYSDKLLEGILTTFKLFFIVLSFGMPFSVICAVLKTAAPKPVKWFLNLYTWIFRGTPLIVQLVIVYRGLPQMGITLEDWTCALIVFCLSFSAYETEVIRGGIISVDKGQYEACKALGMSFIQSMRRVIVPQTIRRVLPTTCSEVIMLFKDTSLVSAIAVFDLMRVARNMAMKDFRIDGFVFALFVYLIVSSVIVAFFGRFEKRLARSL